MAAQFRECVTYETGVARWARSIDLLELERVLVPVNMDCSHWCLVVVYVQERRIVFYDSLAGGVDKGNACLRLILFYLKARLGEDVDVAAWNLEMGVCPQQNNFCDCGVFACLAADFIVNNELLEYSQEQMGGYRTRMAHFSRIGSLEGEVVE